MKLLMDRRLVHYLKAFKEFSPEFMVESYRKDDVEDSSALHMP